MLNYIKSELYRIVSSKGIYLFTFGVATFALAMNMLLFVMNQVEVDFPYGTARFSISNFVVFIYLIMLAAGLMTALFYADDRKNGTLKNALMAGLSRIQLFVAKCIISTCFGLLSLMIILCIYLGSTIVLLEGSATEAIVVLLQGVIAILPASIAALVFAIASFHFIKNTYWAQIFWIAILFAVPIFIHILGLYFDPLAVFATWIPTNIFLYEVDVTFSVFDCVWQNDFGMMKCIATGILSLVIYGGFGVLCSRRMEF